MYAWLMGSEHFSNPGRVLTREREEGGGRETDREQIDNGNNSSQGVSQQCFVFVMSPSTPGSSSHLL